MAHRSVTTLSCLVALVALGGCGSDGAPGPGELDGPAEAREAARHGGGPSTLARAKGLTELFVEEDPTIDPSKTAGENADAVAAQVKAKVCATAAVAHTTGSATVTVDFGSGCTIGSLGAVSGKVAVTVAKDGGKVTVAFTLTGVMVTGATLDGTVSASTSNGTSYATTADLTENGNHVTFTGTFALDAMAAGVTIDGTGTSQAAGGPLVTYKAAAIHHLFGGCYADAGSLALTTQTKDRRGRTVMTTETIAFTSDTPSTGKVTVTVAGQANAATLPAYGSCPQ